MSDKSSLSPFEEFCNDFKKTSKMVADHTQQNRPVKTTRTYAENLAFAFDSIQFTQALCQCIENGLKADAEEVQLLMKEHLRLCSFSTTHSKESYLLIAKWLKKRSPMHKYYAALHPKIPLFLSKAIHIFAETGFPAEIKV